VDPNRQSAARVLTEKKIANLQSRPIRAWAARTAGSALEVFEFDAGVLGPEDVEIAVEYCGICHSDLSMLHNDCGDLYLSFRARTRGGRKGHRARRTRQGSGDWSARGRRLEVSQGYYRVT
jgi:hypothetical protein